MTTRHRGHVTAHETMQLAALRETLLAYSCSHVTPVRAEARAFTRHRARNYTLSCRAGRPSSWKDCVKPLRQARCRPRGITGA